MINDTIRVLSTVTESLAIGTNLGLLHFVWMLVSGALLPNRGALFPALKSIGLSVGGIEEREMASERASEGVARVCTKAERLAGPPA